MMRKNKSQKKLIFDVIPATRISFGQSQIFSYSASSSLAKEIKIGQEVLVPFGNRKMRGVVADCKATKTGDLSFRGKLKNIIGITDSKPLLMENQFKLAKWLADYYHVSLGLAIKAMLPKRAKKRILEVGKSKPVKTGLPSLNYGQKRVFNQIISQKQGIFLISKISRAERVKIYLHVVKKLSEEKKQAIILVPESYLIKDIVDDFQGFFSNQIAVLHSKLSAGEFFSEWQKIREVKAKIIIGTRIAVFAPVEKLGVIIIDEEHDSSYKSDMSPRYNAKKVALELARLFKSKVILGSLFPSIESYYQTVLKNYKLFKMPSFNLPKVKVINMAEEILLGNRSIFSEEALESLKNALSQKKKTLIFINRRGVSNFIICQDCGYVVKCKNCDVPLVYHIKPSLPLSEEKLICHHCNFYQPLPTLCSKCLSPYIKYYGAGTQRVEAEINKLFPDAKIARIDSDTISKKYSSQKSHGKFLEEKTDVIIGTQLLIKKNILSKAHLLIIISVDGILNLPDFCSNERVFRLVCQMISCINPSGEVFLQTHNPDHFVIKAASSFDFKNFYNKEIQDRRENKYPPFSQLIRLSFAHYDQKKAMKEAENLAKRISQKSSFFKKVEILGPAPAFFNKVKNKYLWNIILKIKEGDLKLKKDLLRLVPNKWTIDVDPESLL